MLRNIYREVLSESYFSVMLWKQLTEPRVSQTHGDVYSKAKSLNKCFPRPHRIVLNENNVKETVLWG